MAFLRRTPVGTLTHARGILPPLTADADADADADAAAAALYIPVHFALLPLPWGPALLLAR